MASFLWSTPSTGPSKHLMMNSPVVLPGWVVEFPLSRRQRASMPMSICRRGLKRNTSLERRSQQSTGSPLLSPLSLPSQLTTLPLSHLVNDGVQETPPSPPSTPTKTSSPQLFFDLAGANVGF